LPRRWVQILLLRGLKDRVDGGHPVLGRLRGLLSLRRRLPALRLGDCTALDTERMLAYLRSTDRIAETVLVVINPTAAPLTERLALPDPRLMTGSPLVDAQTGQRVAAIDCGTVSVTVPARSARILSIEMPPPNRYTPYRRIEGG
jgi:hypothetical protein